MSDTPQTSRNGTISVETFQDRGTGKYFLAVVHVDRNGDHEIIGKGYANLDQAKSAAWELARQFNAVALPTKRRTGR